MKSCYICKLEKSLDCFGKLKNSRDGLRYDCKDCRKEYRIKNNVHIQEKNKKYYEDKKDDMLSKNKIYREQHKTEICEQRKEYRTREENKVRIKQKNKEYLPIRKMKIKEKRKTDLNFKLGEILRSKIHKMLKNQKTSYTKYIGCDVEWLKKWLEFRFDENMKWDNLGSYWQIDHILPIHGFDFAKETDIRVCFHWTNLQPLTGTENREKGKKLALHYYFNNIVNINRFNSKNTQYLGYEALNESLKWLRVELRYRKNPSYEDVLNTSKIGNPQPSL
jgi:hypothetical protein